MNEFELIQRLTKDLPTDDSVVVGVGDDCAVLDLGLPTEHLLFKADAVEEGVHFTRETSPEHIGHKALARAVSDIAAMAGRPTHALVTLGLPEGFKADRIDSIYTGMRSLADRCGIRIVGGETTRALGGLSISVALLGVVPKDRCVRRAGARPGDGIFVSGELGGSLDGWHLRFEPRLRQAQWLSETFDVHCMIDLSDGLAGDLRHLLNASQVGAELHSASIPVSRAARLRSKSEGAEKTPLLAALTDGEDFELLFTVASRDAVPLLDGWQEQFPDLKLTCIGKITDQPGLQIRDHKGIKPLGAHGYQHFE